MLSENTRNVLELRNENILEAGVSLFDMLTHLVERQSGNPTVYPLNPDYEFILSKCMEKNFFSRMRVG